MPSDSGSGWTPPAANGERRLSNSSDGSAGSGYSKATTDSADFLATRPHTAAVIPGKPAGNPLQFVRVGPADLGSRARDQLRRAELAKRTEPARIDRPEDWQSNLDNWKSSRRKRVEHIIERCVEVRRMENEPSQPRTKSKTFNEMLEERAGRRRRNPLALFTDDDGNDLSDLGIGTSSTKSSLSEDCDTHSLASDGVDLDKNHSDVDNLSNCDNNRKIGSSANEYDTCTTMTSSPEPEEYTYEGAIEGYKSRIISQTNSSIVKTAVNHNYKEKSLDKAHDDNFNKIKTSLSNKIDEKLSSFQNENPEDAASVNQRRDLPKVNIHKRREQFERENSKDLFTNKPKQPEIANKTSIKERLSSLAKFTEETQLQKSTTDLNKLTEVEPLKNRLTCLEKSTKPDMDKTKRLSSDELYKTQSVKDRLSSLKSQSCDEIKPPKMDLKQVSMSIQERLSCLESAKEKDIPKISVAEDIAKSEQTSNQTKDKDSSLKSSLSGIEIQMQSFCRSLDSLDINGQSSPNSFERVQSLEDFDCVEIQNNTVPSDIETEDSGIHTARDSCVPADDIADLTQIASPIEDTTIEITECESPDEGGVSDTFEPTKIELMSDGEATHPKILRETIIEEPEDQTEDSDSASNYMQAVSQLEDNSVTEVTEINMDKEDEDTLKSSDNQDSSVSLNEPISNTSEADAVVFEGKMTIHLNLTNLYENINKGSGNTDNIETNASNTTSTYCKTMPIATVSKITTTNISPKNSKPSTSLTNKPELLYSCNATNDAATRDYVISSINRHTEQTVEAIHLKPAADANSEMVIDALELAFMELDTENSIANSAMENSSNNQSKVHSEPQTSNENKPEHSAPLYENVFCQSNVDGTTVFPLDMPINVLEPPKEKPPPPPIEEVVDDELLGNGNFKHTSSARRIKKEIRNKRTSFLGIEGQVDDSYLDAELTLAPRPDITSFLQQETQIQKLLFNRTLSQDLDTKLRESRDSGVGIDRVPTAEAWYKGQSSADTSNQHSRQNSEPCTHLPSMSGEEEAAKKQSGQTFNDNLTSKLSTLSEPTESDEGKIQSLDKKLQQQQTCRTNEDWPDGQYDDAHTKEVLRFERELLQLEQEELRRQRENLLKDQTRILRKSSQDIRLSTASSPEKPPRHERSKAGSESYRHSMPNLLAHEGYTPAEPAIPERRLFDDHLKRKPFVSEEHIQRHFGVEESRRVLYHDRALSLVEAKKRPTPCLLRPPQPILPPKPKSRETIEREITMRSSRVPSAVEYVNVDRTTIQLRQKPTPPPVTVNGANSQYHPMSRHTLQALSAAPTPKLISSSDWLQSRNRKPANYHHNQHWLVQEAEQRRIEEQRTKMRANQRHSYHQDMTPTPLNLHPSPLSERQPAECNRSPRVVPSHPEPPREDKLLSVSGRRKCSHCNEQLGRGAAMIIESLSLCYHVWCFTCAVCGARLGDGRAGADVRVRGNRLHCHHCYSGDDGRKYSCV